MRQWNALPRDLLISISEYIYGKDLLCFKLVCKSWNNAAQDWPHKNCPYIIYRKTGIKRLIFLQHDSSISVPIPPELENTQGEMLCSNSGSVLTRRKMWTCRTAEDVPFLFNTWTDIQEKNIPFFFNPFTKDTVQLTRFPLLSYFEGFTFFGEPTSDDCLLVGFAMLANSGVGICLVHLGSGEYQSTKYFSNVELNVRGCSPVMRDEMIFFMDMKGNILTFNMGDGTWNFHLDCLSPLDLQNNIKERFLICDGEDIIGVFVYGRRCKVGVYKLSGEMTWIQLDNIGDSVYYVSSGASFAMVSTTKANRIYFDKFYKGNAVFYSLTSKNYGSHTTPFVNQENYALTQYGTWIAPPG